MWPQCGIGIQWNADVVFKAKNDLLHVKFGIQPSRRSAALQVSSVLCFRGGWEPGPASRDSHMSAHHDSVQAKLSGGGLYITIMKN